MAVSRLHTIAPSPHSRRTRFRVHEPRLGRGYQAAAVRVAGRSGSGVRRLWAEFKADDAVRSTAVGCIVGGSYLVANRLVGKHDSSGQCPIKRSWDDEFRLAFQKSYSAGRIQTAESCAELVDRYSLEW